MVYKNEKISERIYWKIILNKTKCFVALPASRAEKMVK